MNAFSVLESNAALALGLLYKVVIHTTKVSLDGFSWPPSIPT